MMTFRLMKKTYDDLTEEELEYLHDRYEYVEDYFRRDDELQELDIAEYDEMRRIEDYGLNDDEVDDDD